MALGLAAPRMWSVQCGGESWSLGVRCPQQQQQRRTSLEWKSGKLSRMRKTWNAGLGDDVLYDVEEAQDDHIETTLDMMDEGVDKSLESESPDYVLPQFISAAEGGREMERSAAAGTVVDYKINEEEFHKIRLYDCDFFIRKVPDADDDLYDFREMYVTPPDTDVYSIPTTLGRMPQQRARCTRSEWNRICLVMTDDHTNKRAPMGKNEFRAMKVFLMKHYKNRRAKVQNFVLNFEKIYVIDGKTKSIRKAKVKVDVPGGKDRDRSKEILTVRDGGTSFRIIPKEQRQTPDQVIEQFEWNRSRRKMEDYLRTFRDFDKSNWF